MVQFDAISPLDYRYVTGDILEALQPYLSERAAIGYQIKVEVALVKTLADHGICSKSIANEIEKASGAITAEEVHAEEERIKHNVRALVNVMRSKVSDKAKPYVHFTATSNDILSTAEALRLKDVMEKEVIPELMQLEKALIQLARREKKTVQIGRTHGQHAEPITFGHTIASYIARFGRRVLELKSHTAQLKGKFSGPVGAYNALSLIVDNPGKFEIDILKKLELEPGSHSTQIGEAEYALDVYHYITSAFGVLANIADDMRHLQRSEIGEVAEAFGKDQVGSSTMPHKRNPISFENVKSLWKEFMPRMQTAYMDQISEHQRDLTNSASSRFAIEMVAGLYIAARRLRSSFEKMVVDKEALKRNFDANKDLIAAEPGYILLARLGHPDSHEAVRKITLQSEKTGKSFIELLMSNAELQPYLDKLTLEQSTILNEPERYIGIAAKKTEEVCLEWEKKLKL